MCVNEMLVDKEGEDVISNMQSYRISEERREEEKRGEERRR
jgi:hypothetical protein